MPSYNFQKGADTPLWEWQSFFPGGPSYHGTANAYDGVRFIYWAVQYGTTATSASTTQLWQYDTWSDGWGFLATLTSGNYGIDLEYDGIRNVLIATTGVGLTSWQVYNLNTAAVTYINQSIPARSLATVTVVLPAAASYGGSLTMPEDTATIGTLTVDGGSHIDNGIADSVNNTTTSIYSTVATGTFGAGMVGLSVKINTGPQAGQRRIISAVPNPRTLTLSAALPGALAAGNTFDVELPEHAATASTTTTITATGVAWAVNQYSNSDVVVISGAQAGQRRRITSNTVDTLTLSAAVAGNVRTGPLPAALGVGDVFRIVPSSDFLYYQPGGGATTFYRIDVTQTTGTAWTTLAAVPGGVNGGGNTFYPGMYAPFNILALRGGATANYYIYNTGLNTWITPTVYFGAETFNTGASAAMLHGKRKMFIQKEGSTRTYELDLTTNILTASSTLPFANPAGYDGKRARFIKTADGWEYLYVLRAGGQEFFRVALEWMG